jgi:hypothetical protein
MASERFAYRIWSVTEDERQLPFMFNASDMIDALQMAVDFMEQSLNPDRVEVERAGYANPALDMIDVETNLVPDQDDLAGGKMR